MLHRGPGRLLVAAYALFVLASGSRAAVQLSTTFSVAPVPYLLSGLASVVYLVATVALLRDLHRLARATVVVELAGVLLIGTASVVRPSAFPDATVWSQYGSGYGYVPLVLPVLGLLWLHGRS